MSHRYGQSRNLIEHVLEFLGLSARSLDVDSVCCQRQDQRPEWLAPWLLFHAHPFAPVFVDTF